MDTQSSAKMSFEQSNILLNTSGKITEYNQVWKIWEKAKDKLHAYVLSRFKNKELAEETTQEVLFKIYNSCCSGREIRNLNAWLFQIAYNTSLDILQKEAQQDKIAQEEEHQNNSTIWDELSSTLESLIDFLPKKYAIPLKMSDLEGIPQKEIANKLGLEISTTKSRIQRSRKQLKKEILRRYHLELDKKGRPSYVELKDA